MEKLTPQALTILKRRYLLKDKKGRLSETPHQLFSRVARTLAPDDKNQEKKFFEVMANLDFLPNSPTLMNAGTSLGQLSACFVLPVEDSLNSIFDSLKYMALIQQSGGGTGFSFSNLRPRGDTVQTTHGVASGPVSFIHIFNSSRRARIYRNTCRGLIIWMNSKPISNRIRLPLRLQKQDTLTDFLRRIRLALSHNR